VMKLLLIILLLSFTVVVALSPSSVTLPPDCNNSISQGGRYQALVCWLWSSQIHLPNEQFKENVFTISVNDLSCTNFHVTSIKSSYSPSSTEKEKKKDPSLQVDLTGISATCNGKYTWSGIGSGSGNVVASVSGGNSDNNGSPLHLEMDITSAPLSDHVKNFSPSPSTQTKASLPFPTLATISSCQPNFIVHDVQFTGSASAKIIGLFSKMISNKLTSVLNEQVCSLIKKNGEKALDGSFHAAGEYLGGLILQPSEEDYSGSATISEGVVSLLPQRMDQEIDLLQQDDVVSWDADMPLLKRVLLSLNNFIEDHINEGIILKTLQTINPAKCEDCGFFFKGFNGMVNSFTQGTGSAVIFLPENHNYTFKIPSYGNMTISAQRIEVSGLNNLTEFSLLNPVGQNWMSSSIASAAGLHFTILMNMVVAPSGDAIQGNKLNETFWLELNTSNTNFSAVSMFEFDREVLTKLTVGSFIDGSYTTFDNKHSIIHCVLEALSSIALTDLNGRMNLPGMSIAPLIYAVSTNETSLEDNIDDLINNMMQLMLREYPATITESLTSLIQGPVQDLINTALSNFMNDFNKLPLHCVNNEVPHKAVSRPLRFDDNVYVWMFDSLFGGADAIKVANKFIDCVVNILTQNITSLSYRFGDISVELYNLTVTNFGSVYVLDLLRPEIDHYHIKNKLGWGECENNSCNTTLSFGMKFSHTQRGHIGEMNTHLNLNTLELNAGTGLEYDMNYLPNVQVTDLLAHPQCYAIPVTNFGFYDFNMTVGLLDLSINASIVGGSHAKTQTFSYNTVDSTKLAMTVSEMLSDGGLQLQQALEKLSIKELKEASSVCTTPVNPNRSYSSQHPAGPAAGTWTLLIVIVFIAFNAWLFQREFSDKQESGSTGLTQPLLGDSQDEGRDSNQDEINEVMEVESPLRQKAIVSSSSSLMYHPSIHNILRYVFPIVLSLTIILLLTSNLSTGASVDLQVTKVNGQSLIQSINIYEFSLSSTLGEMWRAGVYMLMLLIWLCSGVWPYVKLILMIICWVTSTKTLPPIKREKILYLLDCLGKFSLVDAYVLVLMMVAFRYNLEVAGVGAVDVYVAPKYGFYSFLFVTIVSLFSGHAMLFLHRRSTLPSIPVDSGRYESLSKHVYDDKRGRGLLKMRKCFRRTVIFAFIFTFMLILIGANLHSFRFSFDGVAGVVLGESRHREFSLVSIGESISQSVQNESFGIHWIKMTYFFFALVMPLVCLTLLFTLFIIPMRLKRQQQIFILAEIANAWSAIEVFVIAVLASLVEIGPFSASMVEQHCILFDQLLSGFTGSGGDKLHHCFRVKSSIDGSVAVLVIAVILNSLLVSTLHRLCHHAIWERIEREDRPNSSPDESRTVKDCVLAHTFVSNVRMTKLGFIMFEEITFGPLESDYNFENIYEDEEPSSTNFWQDWRKIVSVI